MNDMEKLRVLMYRKRYTIRRLADDSGVSYQILCKGIRGIRHLSLDSIVSICKTLDIKPNEIAYYFLGGQTTEWRCE